MAGNTIELTDATFQESISSNKLILIDFWATWCGPCKAVAPVLEQLAAEMKDQVVIAKMDVDKNRTVPGSLGVRSIPTMVLFKNGQPIDQVVGALPKEKIQELIKKHL